MTTSDRPLYPRIDPPKRQPDGAYIVRVFATPDEMSDDRVETLEQAQQLVRLYERAAVKLLPRPRRPMGRPSKLTLAVIEDVCKCFEDGNTVTATMGHCGLSKANWDEWRRRGIAAKRGIYAEFYRRTSRAIREGQYKLEARLLATRDDRTLLEVVRRRFPADWAATRAIEVSGPGGGPIQQVSGDEAIAKLSAILDRLAGEEAEGDEGPGRP